MISDENLLVGLLVELSQPQVFCVKMQKTEPDHAKPQNPFRSDNKKNIINIKL